MMGIDITGCSGVLCIYYFEISNTMRRQWEHAMDDVFENGRFALFARTKDS